MNPPTSETRWLLTPWILGAGAIAYIFLCLPAIGRRGYPPIDPVWMGVTYVWIVPVCLVALLDPRKFRDRQVTMAIYAFSTGFIDAGTEGGITPRHMSLLVMLVMSPFYGAFHCVVIIVVEGLLELVTKKIRSKSDIVSGTTLIPRFSLATWMMGFTVLCLGLGFPFAYRHVELSALRSRGIASAEQDWAAKEARTYRNFGDRLGGRNIYIEYEFDPQSGLPQEHAPSNLGWSDAYNKRIEELIDEHGLPKYSLKAVIPAPEQIADLFTATDFEEVLSFPHELTPDLVLLRRGTSNMNGTMVTAVRSDLNLVTPTGTIELDHGGAMQGGTSQRVEVQVGDARFVIRNGPRSIIVLNRDGRIICRAIR